MARRYTEITRRPGRKKQLGKAKNRDKRHQKKRAAHEHTRKLARKLSRIATMIDKGEYNGVKNSPLLQLNWDFVIKRSMIAKSYFGGKS